MKKASSDPPNIDTIRSGAAGSAHGVRHSSSNRSHGNSANIVTDSIDLSSKSSLPATQRNNTFDTTASTTNSSNGVANGVSSHITSSSASNNLTLTYPDDINEKTSPRDLEDVAISSKTSRQGAVVDEEGALKKNQTPEQKQKPGVFARFYLTCKMILFHSWVNVLLVFVPVGIITKALGVSPGIVFAMNAIAIIPLAGLLSHATESVASKLGDTIGALLNVTFGNAVELIIL